MSNSQPVGPDLGQTTMPWIKYPGLKEAGRKLVEQSARKLSRGRIIRSSHVRRLGNPAEMIMKVASKQHADLIVMGAKGLGCH